MKNLFFLILIVFYSHLFNAQDFSRFNCQFKIKGKTPQIALTGGLNSPQFNMIDLNLDGEKDLVVFDRTGNEIMCFLYSKDGAYPYRFSPSFNQIFPEIENWMLLIDYNNDGIEDIFTSMNNGIRVFKGEIINNKWQFSLLQNPYFNEDILSAKYENGFTFRVVCNDTDIPAITDIDMDGDLDILSFTDGASLSMFKNVCLENNIPLDSFKLIQTERCWGKFAENPFSEEVLLSKDPYRCAVWDSTSIRHSGSTSLAIDFDNDNDKDLLLGDVGYNSLIFLENNGDISNAWITKQERDFPQYDKPVDLNVFLGVFNVDVDKDGLKDLVIAPNAEYDDLDPPQNVENVHFYKNITTNDTFKFHFIQNDFLIKQMLDFGVNSVPVFTDINGDSLMDIVVGTGPVVNSENILPSKLIYFKNTGTAIAPYFTLEDDDYLGLSTISKDLNLNYFTPAFGDIDGDGDNDLLVGNHEGNLIFFKNIANTGSEYKFDAPVTDFEGIDVFSFSSPMIFDMNGDGLGDILVGCGNDYHTPLQYYGSIVYFENTGTNGNPSFTSDPFTSPNTPFYGKVILSNLSTSISNAHLSYYKDDNDELLFTGYKTGKIKVYNQFSSHIYDELPILNADYANIDVGSNSAPAVADIDGDGYLEMLVGSKRGGLEFWNTDFKVKKGLNTKEANFNNKTKIYPNPFKNKISIDLNYKGSFTICIYNVFGKKVKSKKITKNNTIISLNELKEGIYFLEIISKKKHFVHKLIKSN